MTDHELALYVVVPAVRHEIEQRQLERDTLRARLAEVERECDEAIQDRDAERNARQIDIEDKSYAEERAEKAEQRLAEAEPIIAAVARAPLLDAVNKQIGETVTQVGIVTAAICDAARAYQAEHAQPQGDAGKEGKA